MYKAGETIVRQLLQERIPRAIANQEHIAAPHITNQGPQDHLMLLLPQEVLLPVAEIQAQAVAVGPAGVLMMAQEVLQDLQTVVGLTQEVVVAVQGLQEARILVVVAVHDLQDRVQEVPLPHHLLLEVPDQVEEGKIYIHLGFQIIT